MRVQEPVPPKTRSLMAALEEFDAARAAGVDLAACEAGLTEVLADLFPAKTPRQEGLFTCHHCEDTGMAQLFCDAQLRCGRTVCATASADYVHTYVEPCFCTKGDRFRPPPPTEPAELPPPPKRTRAKTYASRYRR